MGGEALRQSRIAWLVYFYASADSHGARLSLAAISVLLFTGRILEAFADTLIGYWSDRTSSRFGRRLPFIFLATPPMAIFAVLLFMPPTHAHGLLLGLYFFAIMEVFFLFNSLVNVPYEALLPEIARTSSDRVSITSWRVQFGVAGAAIGLIGSGLLIGRFGYVVMAIALASLALVTRYVGILGIRHLVQREASPTSSSLRESIRTTAQNRPLLAFLLSFVMFGTGLSMLVGLLPFYVTTVLRKADTGTWSGVLTAVGIGTMALAVPLFGRLANRTSPEYAYKRAMLASAIAFPVLFLAGSMSIVSKDAQALVAMVIVGAPLAGVYLFPGPIVAHFCDAERDLTGQQREGMLFSIQAFMDKVVEAFAPLFLGLVLLLGDRPGDTLGVRLVGPVAGLVVFAGFLLVRTWGTAPNTDSSLQRSEAESRSTLTQLE